MLTDLSSYRSNLNRGFVVAIASDHAGVEMKAAIAERLWSVGSVGHFVIDHGPMTTDRVDYPDHAALVCGSVLSGEADRGILICGSGIGMSMAANRFREIRCALVQEPLSASLSRLHNNSNVISIGARLIGIDMAWECVHLWLKTPYEGGRHDARLSKMDGMGT
jgi:ribose 5-phosphate isomerase B